MDQFTILPHLLALSVAYALAFPIAWDREREARSAGLRTFPLVAIAACGFVQASEGFAGDGRPPPPAPPTSARTARLDSNRTRP